MLLFISDFKLEENLVNENTYKSIETPFGLDNSSGWFYDFTSLIPRDLANICRQKSVVHNRAIDFWSYDHNSLKIWTFWACKTSFGKLVSGALRSLKNNKGVPLKKSEKNSFEDRSIFDDLKIFEHENLWRMAMNFFETWLKFFVCFRRFQRYRTPLWTKSEVLMTELTWCA